MTLRLGEGNGHSKGLIDIVPLKEGCSVFMANPQQPPPADEMPEAITDVLTKWMAQQPVEVRHTLPITKDGNTTVLFVWWERTAPPAPLTAPPPPPPGEP
jgi:hypothetical protein